MMWSKAIWKKSSKSNLKTLPNVKMMKNANDAIIGWIHPVFLYFYDTTNIDLTFSRIKLSLTLKWEKVVILRLLLTPRAWRVVLVCPHSISVSASINYTNMAATSHVKLGILKSKWIAVEFGHCHEDKRTFCISIF